MTSPLPPSKDDRTAVEKLAGGPLLYLAGSGVLWLVLASILGLVVRIQSHTPDFFADCPALSAGRCRALAETALIYGWIGNAGMALVLWLLARLAGEPLRTIRWVRIGGLFWNVGLVVGLGGIATGDATGLPWLELPRYVLPLLVAAYAAVALGGVLAWTGRRREVMFAAQWYGVAALFLLPWILCASQVTLLWFPLRGVSQAVAASWCAQGLWTLWIAPVLLACAYYLTAKLSSRTLPAYEEAPAAFWVLLFIGAWTGGRHLIGGPVPAWISSVAIVATAVLIFHYVIVGLNLRPALGLPDPAARFVAAGVAAYCLGGLLDAFTALRAVAVTTQFTAFDEAQGQLALAGAASLTLIGALYFVLPRLKGRPWFSAQLRTAHLALALLGVLLLVVGLAFAGLVQGAALNDPAVSFAEIAERMKPGLLVATGGQGLFLAGTLAFAVNFFKSVCTKGSAGEPVEERARAREVSAT